MSKHKYYVVWKGRKTGIFTSWAECEKQVKGFLGAEYKAFGTLKEAEAAFRSGYDAYKGRPASRLGNGRKRVLSQFCHPFVWTQLAVVHPENWNIAACLLNQDQVFRVGPFPDGTNNVGEFLAIVHALSWMVKNEAQLPVYSDSENAIAWVYTGTCKTNLKRTAKNAPLFVMIRSAENWLAENELLDDAVLKWDTELWGENPADFGRK